MMDEIMISIDTLTYISNGENWQNVGKARMKRFWLDNFELPHSLC